MQSGVRDPIEIGNGLWEVCRITIVRMHIVCIYNILHGCYTYPLTVLICEHCEQYLNKDGYG